jgi:hypothetical protein
VSVAVQVEDVGDVVEFVEAVLAAEVIVVVGATAVIEGVTREREIIVPQSRI